MGLKRKKKADGEGAEDTGRGGGKSNLLPAMVLAVGMLGGGFFFSQKSAPAPVEAAAEGEGEAEEEPSEVHEGAVVTVDPITLNLADGHFLKVGLALQMAPVEGGEAAGGHGGGGDEESPLGTGGEAKALDETIRTLSQHTMAELSEPAKREEVKTHLAERITEAYHGEVSGLYFTEFVMQ